MSELSHEYAFGAGPLARRLALLAAGVAGIVLVLHALEWMDWLPQAQPTELEAVILTEKVRLARISGPAELVLAGDSSCMMDVDTPELARLLGVSAINFGTLSYLSLPAQSDLLAHYTGRQTQQPRRIVLLMHPDALRLQESPAEYHAFLRSQFSLDAGSAGLQPRRIWEKWSATELLRGRVLASWIPSVLPGEFGTEYGSNLELRRYLVRHSGSLVEPGVLDVSAGQGSREYRLASGLEADTRDFRRSIPEGSILQLGITPIPESLAAHDHEATVRSMLATWAGWAQADLLSLPATLPDPLFASRTHLNREGIKVFTRALANGLSPAFR